MVRLGEIEAQAMELAEGERAKLAASLLNSLPDLTSEDDDDFREALRRDAEMEQDPSLGMTTSQLRKALGR